MFGRRQLMLFGDGRPARGDRSFPGRSLVGRLGLVLGPVVDLDRVDVTHDRGVVGLVHAVGEFRLGIGRFGNFDLNSENLVASSCSGMPMITSTPNTSSSTSRGTATQTLTRSATMVDEMKPRAPPASRTGAALGKRGMPLLMWISPSRPIRAQLQPTTWRPAGPLLGVSQGPPGHQQGEQRKRDTERAEDGGDADVDPVTEGAGNAEPELSGDQHRQTDQRQADSVAA